jgi:hypothetical protein
MRRRWSTCACSSVHTKSFYTSVRQSSGVLSSEIQSAKCHPRPSGRLLRLRPLVRTELLCTRALACGLLLELA